MNTVLKRGEHYHNTTKAALFGDSPTQQQQKWLDAKKKEPNAIHMVHVGKFYELFHSDADVFNELFEAPYMRGVIAHTGFPEVALNQFKTLLEEKNFKVILI